MEYSSDCPKCGLEVLVETDKRKAEIEVNHPCGAWIEVTIDTYNEIHKTIWWNEGEED